MYRIRAFGDDRDCSTIDELQQTLKDHYAGRAVSVTYRAAPFGMRRSRFFDVQSDGQAVDSYGAQEAVDFEAIQADQQGDN